MDCRLSLILGLGVLGGAAGCTPSLFTHNSTPAAFQTARKESPTAEEVASAKVEAEQPKRKPKASTCVTFGDFCLRESLAPASSPEEQRQRRALARRAYEQALEIDPQCAEAYRGLAQLYTAEQQPERAISTYQSAVRALPRSAALWFDLGMLHSQRREWEPAIDALAHAADLDPTNRQYANVLGFCLARAGRYEQSLAYFTRVVGEARAHFNVGRMMMHNGQADAARQHLELALQREPNLTEARELLAQLNRPQNRPAQPIVPVQYQEPVRP